MDTERAQLDDTRTYETVPKPEAPTLHENMLALAETTSNLADAVNRLGQRMQDAEAQIERLLREVGK